ncbi:glycosyltransferase [Sphingomonas cavernae]|uniref:Glycosyltransferase n=1 Tax=Sphingomonas cavernae TaxID=2320861 RepID=A0A418W6V5_9SPHN|nr:glycosyltransferase [Sphingomonas cavernae]RJF85771.1 glycosyltransferase [Sphingomonas cavernae]
MRRKILFIINSLTGGGAERVMATLLRHSEGWRERFEIELALLDNEPQAYAVPDWVTVHRLDCGFSLARSALRLRRLVGRIRPDATLSFLTRANVANAYAMRGRGRPWIISERVNTSAHLGNDAAGKFGRMLVRYTYPKASAVIAVSHGVADDLVHNFAVPVARVTAIANPVDVDFIARRATEPPPIAVDGRYVAAMGRLVENKNFAMLIDAFAASGVAGKLVIGGDGPLRGALEAQIARLGLQSRVILAGFLENPFPLVAGARYFVLPSNAEGFPNGLVEAMATGVAVVSTNCLSGPSEILAEAAREDISGVTRAKHGILVPCNDAAAMAGAMRSLEDKTVREHYATAALNRARAFAPENAARRYWRVIEQALDGPQPGHAN